MPPSVSSRERFWLFALFVVFTLVWFYMLSVRTLVPTDEGRYAEMAREMLATHDWITTRLNAIKYFEKPPLQIWVTAATFKLFGLGDWQARLWTGFCGWLSILLMGYAGWRIFSPRVGYFTALVLGSSLWWVGMGQVNSLDMGLSGMMTLVLAAMLLAQHDGATKTEQRNWMLACWAGMGLSFLSKSLIGLLIPGAILVLYTLITRDWKLWARLHIGKGLILFLAISLPWLMLVSQRNPEFLQFFFINQQFERFLTKIHDRYGPWYYFIPLLVVGILPWLGTLIQALIKSLRKPESHFRPLLLTAIWAIFIFVFFSKSDSKLPGYILPIFPALALLIGHHLDTAPKRDLYWAAWLTAGLGAIGIGLSPQIHHFAGDPILAPYFQACEPWAAAGSVALLGGVLAYWVDKNGKRTAAVSTLAISAFVAFELLAAGTQAYGNYRSGKLLLPAIEQQLTPETKLYAVGLYDQTLPFYLRRTMTLVATQDELYFGLSIQPELWIPTVDDFLKVWEHGPKSVAIMAPEIYDRLKKQGNVPLQLLARDTRRVAVTNQN